MNAVVLRGVLFLSVAILASPATPANQPASTGTFVNLFNGKNLAGWRSGSGSKDKLDLDGKSVSPDKRFEVFEGVLIAAGENVLPSSVPNPGLFTVRDYPKDLHLRLEFRAGAGAECKVLIRGVPIALRDFSGSSSKLKCYKDGEWNEVEIVVQNEVFEISVNQKAVGAKDVLSVNTVKGKAEAKLNDQSIELRSLSVKSRGTAATCTCNGEPFETKLVIPRDAKGGIGFQPKSGRFEIRNVQVRELP